MKKSLLFFISLLVGFGLFFWILKTVGVEGIKHSLMIFSSWKGLIILSLTLVVPLISILKWQAILRGSGFNLSVKDLTSPYLVGFSVMYLAPIMIWAGELLRAYTLKEKYGISLSKGIASVIIDRATEWTANLATILLGISCFLFLGLPTDKSLLVFAIFFLGFSSFIVFFYFKCFKKESIVRFLSRNEKAEPLEVEKELFTFFRVKNTLMWKAISLAFLRVLVVILRNFLLIFFLGKTVGIMPAIAIAGFNYLAMMIPIPTALGSHEAIQTFAFTSLGLGAVTATAFTMIIRAAEVLISLMGIILFFRLGIFLIKNSLFKKLEKLFTSSAV